MKDFLKYTLATIVGLIAGTIIITIVSIVSIIGITASSNTATTVSENSIFKLELKGEVTERMVDNPFASLMNEEQTALGLNDILASIQKAADNPYIKGIYLEAGGIIADPAGIEEIRNALIRFKQANKFVVAYGDSDDETNRILLLSTMEWRGVTSATHEDTPAMATDIASTYTEGDFSDWRIPTRDEVRKMCAASGDMSLDATNECLRTNGIAPLGIGDDAETGDAIRYLCDEAAYSFRWDSDGKPSAAGRKRTYHLRLVRTVEFAAK